MKSTYEEIKFNLNPDKLKKVLGLDKEWVLVAQKEHEYLYQAGNPDPLPQGFMITFRKKIKEEKLCRK